MGMAVRPLLLMSSIRLLVVTWIAIITVGVAILLMGITMIVVAEVAALLGKVVACLFLIFRGEGLGLVKAGAPVEQLLQYHLVLADDTLYQLLQLIEFSFGQGT